MIRRDKRNYKQRWKKRWSIENMNNLTSPIIRIPDLLNLTQWLSSFFFLLLNIFSIGKYHKSLEEWGEGKEKEEGKKLFWDWQLMQDKSKPHEHKDRKIIKGCRERMIKV